MGSQEAGDDGSKFLNILRVDLSDVAHPEGICIGELARVEDVAPLLDVGVKLGLNEQTETKLLRQFMRRNV